MSTLDELDHFINQTKYAREIKRTLAVTMKLQGKHYRVRRNEINRVSGHIKLAILTKQGQIIPQKL